MVNNLQLTIARGPSEKCSSFTGQIKHTKFSTIIISMNYIHFKFTKKKCLEKGVYEL